MIEGCASLHLLDACCKRKVLVPGLRPLKIRELGVLNLKLCDNSVNALPQQASHASAV